MKHMASDVFIAFWLVLPFKETNNISIALYLQIFKTQNYILYKISASGLFLNYS